ncbi:MAG: hypothetical protein HGB03_02115 [Candidatus Yonathbacteria bacterium]|nr:hypothetical protein [Candidatus Yonathbacteria bacterium]NTW48052.1 hypothetical protein [Candidatus Yonathbacteria bacterium]
MCCIFAAVVDIFLPVQHPTDDHHRPDAVRELNNRRIFFKEQNLYRMANDMFVIRTKGRNVREP